MPTKNKAPRLPTVEEQQQLTDWYINHHYSTPSKEDIAVEAELVQSASLAVFDHYMTDCPGYAGKVMVVVWPGAPGMLSSFTWDEDGDLVEED